MRRPTDRDRLARLRQPDDRPRPIPSSGGHPLPVAAPRFPEALGRPDDLGARVGRDADGGAAGRAPRPGRRSVPDGAHRGLVEPRRAPGRLVRGRVGRPRCGADRSSSRPTSCARSCCCRSRSPTSPASCASSSCTSWSSSSAAAGRSSSAAYPGVRALAHRRRPRRRGQQQARDQLVPRRDRRAGPRSAPWSR